MRRRVDSKAGRRGGRRGFSDQWGESEISERSALREASFERMTCHLEAKEVMERVEGRRLLRSWDMFSSISEGISGAGEDCGGGTVAGGILLL